jgi:hypothetical protein
MIKKIDKICPEEGLFDTTNSNPANNDPINKNPATDPEPTIIE